MKEEVKQLWLSALRSGAYQQGHYRLRLDVLRPRPSEEVFHPYCCLGVLCEVYRQQTGNGVWGEDGIFIAAANDSSRASLPAAVVDWAELHSPDPVIGTHRLSKYNDGIKQESIDPEDMVVLKKNDFNEIANLIEANL